MALPKFGAIRPGGGLLVQLWSHDGVGLIVKAQTNIFYSNQTDGTGCNHPEQEGFYVPMGFSIDDDLHDIVCAWGGEGNVAKFIDALNERIDGRSDGVSFSLDVGESEEAWVHVKVKINEAYKDGPFDPLDGASAVLTWPNCD